MKLVVWNDSYNSIDGVWEEGASRSDIKNKSFLGQDAKFVFCVFLEISCTGETECFLHLILASPNQNFGFVGEVFRGMIEGRERVNGSNIFLIEKGVIGWGRVAITKDAILTFSNCLTESEADMQKWWLQTVESQLREQFMIETVCYCKRKI